MKREEDEENLFKKNYNPEENEKNKLHLQTGKNIAFSGRPSQSFQMMRIMLTCTPILIMMSGKKRINFLVSILAVG